MSPSTALALGDWIRFDDEDHQVVGFSGHAVRLRSASGQPQIVLAGEKLAALRGELSEHLADAPSGGAAQRGRPADPCAASHDTSRDDTTEEP